MSAVLEAHEPSAKYLSALQPQLVQHFELLGTAQGGVAKLRELILTLAVQGKLVPQDPSDEPARELLKKIQAEKTRLIAEGRIKRDKPLAEMADEDAPFALPQGWEFVRLGEIGLVGSSSRVHQSDWKGSGVPFYRAREIVKLSRDGYVSNELFISEEFFASLTLSGWVPEEDDIMITGVGTIGIPYVVRPSDRFYFKDASVLIFKNYGRLNAQWLTWFMRSPLWIEGIHEHSMGTTVDTLTIARANVALVPLPPADEQSRIVTCVEELMRLCDALEAKGQLETAQHGQLVQTLLGALTASTSPEELADNWQRVATHFDILLDRPEAIDALEQTILQLAVRGLLVPEHQEESYGKNEPDGIDIEHIDATELPFEVPPSWRWVRLGSIAELINGDRGTNYPKKAEYVTTGLPFINTGHIEPDGTLSDATMNFLTREKFESLRSGKTKPGDLVYCLRGATLGKTAIVGYPEGAIASSLVIVRPNKLLDRRYAYLYLTSPLGQSLVRRFDNGSAQPNLGAGSVRKYVVPLPALVEQHRIVARVESLRRLCADLRQRLAARQTTQAHLADALIDEVA